MTAGCHRLQQCTPSPKAHVSTNIREGVCLPTCRDEVASVCYSQVPCSSTCLLQDARDEMRQQAEPPSHNGQSTFSLVLVAVGHQLT